MFIIRRRVTREKQGGDYKLQTNKKTKKKKTLRRI